MNHILQGATSTDVQQKARVKRRRKEMRKCLRLCLKYPDSTENLTTAYVCEQDVKSLWTVDNIRETLLPSGLSEEEIREVKDKVLKFLSTLVLLKANADLDKFRDHVFDSDGTLKMMDSLLPLDRKDAPELDDFMMIDFFLQQQYLFLPVTIEESSEPAEIDGKMRLPFESTSTSVMKGAYGFVTKVRISAGYLKVRQGSAANVEPRDVACKRFSSSSSTMSVDAEKELKNLQILKESITENKYVRIHLAILFHGREQIILLPWAQHLDLHLFLLEGHDPHIECNYDFGKEFPNVQRGKFISAVFKQIINIAEALKFLHHGVTVDDPYHQTLYFAHMDLKPGNILVDFDNRLPVGKWVLTDFGISAYKVKQAHDSQDPAQLVSIRQYLERRQYDTIDTEPKRDRGAYQAPEIERSRPSATDGKVGRMLDIWSFGCIFAEVLAFAVGQKDAVVAFRDQRKGRHGNDYFYEPRNLAMFTNTFQIRTEVSRWLREMEAQKSVCNDIVPCSVMAIEKILDVDTKTRPNAEKLVNIMRHVGAHVNGPQAGKDCLLNQKPPRELSPSPIHEHFMEEDVPVPTPAVVRTDTGEQQLLVPEQAQPQVARAAAVEPETVDVSDEPQQETTEPNDKSDRTSGITEESSVRLSHGSTSITDDRSSALCRPFSVEIDIPRRSYFFDTQQQYIKCEKSRLSVPSDTIKSIALCPFGKVVAVLTRPRPYSPQQVLRIFDISLSSLEVAMRKGPQPGLIPLPPNVVWKSITVCEETFAVCGTTSSSTTTIYTGKLNEASANHVRRTENEAGHSWLGQLEAIRISNGGCVVFLCQDEVHYLDLAEPARKPHHLFTSRRVSESIQDAKFSNNTSFLYVFTRSSTEDRVIAWRCVSGSEKFVHQAEQGYYHEGHGEAFASIIPYNGADGCVIRLPGPKFFRSTLPDMRSLLHVKPQLVRSQFPVCMFGPFTLIHATKKRHGLLLKKQLVVLETTIVDDRGQKAIHPNPGFEYPVDIDPNEVTDMKVVDAGCDDFVLIIMTSGGEVAFIRANGSPPTDS